MTIILLLLIVSGVFIVMTYNKLISRAEQVENAKRQIDIQLDRRFKVFEGLINTVRKVMDYEQTVFKDVIKLRNEALQAKKSGDSQAQFEAEESISQIAKNVSVVFEQYPQLKSLDNARQLQEEIVSTENKLSFSKQSYNDAVEVFNSSKNAFFSSMIVSMFPKLNKSFEYWQISAEKAHEYDNTVAKL